MSQWRYIVQRARTGEFLDWDLPLTRDGLSWSLSGAGSLAGSLAPETGALTAHDGLPLLDEWGTYIFAEASGQIRWGGIVVSSDYEDGAWRVEAASFATYPHGTPYLGEYSKIRVPVTDVVRHLWDYVQSQPGGDMGMILDVDDSPVLIGEPAQGEDEAQPYELQWWEAPDVGSEIDSLCEEGRVEYREEHAWVGDQEKIRHTMRVAYPRLGKRRRDLQFVDGENIIVPVAASRSGDDYAGTVVGVGAGEGDASVRVTVPGPEDNRLRRVAVWTDKGVTSCSRLTTQTRRELRRLSRSLEINQVTVRDHDNAPIGSWDLGDDVLIEADVAWLGTVRLWCRIIGWSLIDDVTATLDLARSDSFVYGV